MKIYLPIIFALFIPALLSGQQECRTDIISGYGTSRSGNNLTCTFNLNSSAITPGTTLIWDFGDGSSEVVYDVDPYSYTSQSHTYDLSNISSGVLDMDVILQMQGDDSYLEGICESYYSVYETFSSTPGSAAITVSPDYTGNYPVGSEIRLMVTIDDPYGEYSSSDGITYSVEAPGGRFATGNITMFNSAIEMLTDTLDAVGTYNYYIEVTRFGQYIEDRSTVTITVDSSGSGTNIVEASCDCPEIFYPGISVELADRSTPNKLVALVYNECTDDFNTCFDRCARFWLRVNYPSNHYHFPDTTISILGRKPTNNNYDEFSQMYPGSFGFIASYGDYSHNLRFKQPDIYENNYNYTFEFEIYYYDNGNIISKVASDDLIVPPRDFNPSENYDTVPAEGGTLKINLHKEACYAIDIINKNSPDDTFDWLEFSGEERKKQVFEFKENYDGNPRDLEIKLYVTGEYSKCQDELSGEKLPYRTVHVHQPTFMKDFSDNPNTHTFPAWNFPVSDDDYYYKITEIFSGENFDIENIYYVKDVQDIPLYTSGNKGDTTYWLDVASYGYGYDYSGTGSNKYLLQTRRMKIIKEYCTPERTTWNFGSHIPVLKINTINKDVVSIDTVLTSPHGVIVTAKESLYLLDGFDTKEGSFFDALIADCNIESSPPPNYKSYTPDTAGTTKRFKSKTHNDTTKPPGEYQNIDFIIYPNPTVGLVNLKVFGTKGGVGYFELYTAMGQKTETIYRHHSSGTTLSLHDYSPGLYFVRFVYQDKSIVKKLMYRK